jgi:hypothetical protein
MIGHKKIGLGGAESLQPSFSHSYAASPQIPFCPETNQPGRTFSVGVAKRKEKNWHAPEERVQGYKEEAKGIDKKQTRSFGSE